MILPDQFPDQFSEKFEVIATDDGSFTLKHKEIDETCHSTKGAFSEGHYYYVECSQLVQRYQLNKTGLGPQRPFFVLDVGFGTGLNYLAAIKALTTTSSTPAPPLIYISVEREEELLLYTKANFKALTASFSPPFPPEPFELFPHPQQLQKTIFSETHPLPCYRATSSDGRHQLVILLGDAIDSLYALRVELRGKFEVIFQDPFSPQKSGRLWTLQWFMLLKELANPKDAIVTTFSMSNMGRKGLQAAGFEVIEAIPGYGNKKGATRAYMAPSTTDSTPLFPLLALSFARSEAPLLMLLDDPYYGDQAQQRAQEWQGLYPLTPLKFI